MTFIGKWSRTTWALVFFALLLIISVAGLFVVASVYHPSYFMNATRLTQTPDQYVLLENPNNYVLQAINNADHSIEVKAFEDTQIYGLASSHNPLNLEYEGNYYQIGFAIADSFPPPGLTLLLLAGIVISIMAVVFLTIKSIQHLKNKIEVRVG